jgi:hypothetical protein
LLEVEISCTWELLMCKKELIEVDLVCVVGRSIAVRLVHLWHQLGKPADEWQLLRLLRVLLLQCLQTWGLLLSVEHIRLRTHLHSMLGLLEGSTTLLHSCSKLLMVSWHQTHKGILVALYRLPNELRTHFADVNMRSPNSNALESGELRIGTLDFCIVIGYKLLNHV